MPRSELKSHSIAAVIPAYRVAGQIAAVLRELPSYLRHVIVVDDASTDGTAALVQAAAKRDRRVILLRHGKNLGVGGAMITGFRKALDLGAEIVVKIDGDGQMDIAYLDALLTPLIQGRADFCKGNRFRDFAALRKMPLIRRIGNMGLGFLAKAATGYWNLFDPTNGFLAVRSGMLAQLPLDQIDRGYYFEISMLANLYLLGAVVQDVPMPARYRDEISNLAVERVLLDFPFKLLGTFLRRLALKNFLYDFSMVSIYLLTGLPLLLFGLIYGGVKWAHYYRLGTPAPTGTVILPTLSVLLGIQLLLSAVESDLRSVPRQPLSDPLLGCLPHLMKPGEFGVYKRRYGAAIQQVLSEAEPGRLDEIGFPAYSHTNPLINWLFWRRLHTVMDYVGRQAPYTRALDFGCGSGVMLPFLSRVSAEVVAADVDLHALERMKGRIPLAPNVTVLDASGPAVAQAEIASFDLVIALDVLEHVEDLPGTLAQLLRLLKKGRQLIVSGPTENALYRFGRKLAGPEYSGEYHERGVAEIRRALQRQVHVKQISTLYWPVPLFEIFAATA